MDTVTITRHDTTVAVAAPYDPQFPKRAHELGGQWNGSDRRWEFSARDEQRVRDLCRTIYGTDGTPTPTVTVQIACGQTNAQYTQELRMLGRRMVYRPARDARVVFGAGVIVLAGGFPSSGGSVKNPRLEFQEGTILEVRDVPAAAPGIDHPSVTVMTADEPDRSALEAERARLVARIAEIDAALAQTETEH